ncbi:hypothetical protein F9856_09700 [Streptococcus suis]|uniref:hypothetical protein n=3 Tax=Streptococcus suis TaxID=1307 RepID=UPI000CF4A4E7|nr:hypothetical protein [Streptococcus suis]MBL1126396.1 hypothetical protein [Streptococcus suis]HEM5162048.1 hypothetical protein [Streptococcus suis]
MDRLNECFQTFMREDGFLMKIIEEEEAYKYLGRLSIAPDRLIDFSLLIPKSPDTEVVQIVFDKLGIQDQNHSREEWLEFINQMNLEYGIHYYFCLKEDGSIFARYVLPIRPSNVSLIYDLIRVGSGVIRRFIDEMEERFLVNQE